MLAWKITVYGCLQEDHHFMRIKKHSHIVHSVSAINFYSNNSSNMTQLIFLKSVSISPLFARPDTLFTTISLWRSQRNLKTLLNMLPRLYPLHRCRPCCEQRMVLPSQWNRALTHILQEEVKPKKWHLGFPGKA